MFELRQLLEALVNPLPIALALVVVGAFNYSFGRRLTAHWAVVTAVVLVAGASSGLVGTWLLQPLESQYPGITDASKLVPAPQYVAVLGAGYQPEPGLPVAAALDQDAVVRITEGVILMHELPGVRLIVSGGPVGGNPPSAYGYERAAVALGIPAASIIMIDTPRTTSEEIQALGERVHHAPILLVTSAAHMPRALRYCGIFDVNAIPAPAERLTRPISAWSLGSLLPSARGLRKTEIAWHEYLGLLLVDWEGR